jgi:hypothetical protein
MECTIENNKQKCTCTYEPCSRKGKCCECVVYHREHGELPGCFFPPAVERTYNRSVAKFIQAQKR